MRGINHAEDWGWSAAPRFIGAGTAIAGSGLLSAGSSLFGSGKSSSASKSAANESLLATEYSTAAEENMYSYAEAGLEPYRDLGYTASSAANALAATGGTAGQWYYDQATGQLQNAANYYTPEAQSYLGQSNYYLNQAAGMNPNQVLTQQGLEQTPGYQFTMQQGLKAAQANAAARGLGVSGASLKGAATYATGLADATYSNRFNEAQQSYQDVMNQSTQSLNQAQGALNLSSASENAAGGYTTLGNAAQAAQNQQYQQYYNLGSLGENAAAMSGNAATSAGQQIGSTTMSGAQQYGNYLSQAGQAQAAGTIGVSNALTSGVNSYLTYNALTGLNQTLQGSGTGGFTISPSSQAAWNAAG